MFKKRIYYHDTDAGGVVYYARYLEHLEEGRSEFLRDKSIDLVKYAQSGTIFPVVHLEIDYRSPARYGDSVNIITQVEKIGNASVHFIQEIQCAERVILKAKTVWACVDNNLKPRRIPDEIAVALRS